MDERRPAKKQPRGKSKPFFNVGILIFGLIFIYIIICVVTYFRTDHVAGYEVTAGSLSVTNVFTGVALREEVLIPVQEDGYINYFAAEGQKIGARQFIYTIDGTGRLSEQLKFGSDANSLTDKQLDQIRQDCISFALRFDEHAYSSVYDAKHELRSDVSRLSSVCALDRLEDLNKTSSGGKIKTFYSSMPGIVLYFVDGYEDITREQISGELFDKNKYHRTFLNNNTLLSQGETAYKLCTSEEWSVVIPLDEEQTALLAGEGYVQVRFLKNRITSWAALEIINRPDGTYAVLNFNNSMITFCTDRFIDLELIISEESGLKIPVSAIAEKEFYLIPAEFVFQTEDRKEHYVMRQSYDKGGNETWEAVTVEIYNENDGELYVGEEVLAGGDILRSADSQNAYTIGRRGTLIGVYNINKGYADFRQINILYQNKEYAIVKSNTTYGLCVYDHIVLDASTVSEHDFTN